MDNMDRINPNKGFCAQLDRRERRLKRKSAAALIETELPECDLKRAPPPEQQNPAKDEEENETLQESSRLECREAEEQT